MTGGQNRPPFFVMNTNFPGLNQLGNTKRAEISSINDEYFGYGLQLISRYSLSCDAILHRSEQSANRNYIIEIHHYDGFAMLKFYPRMRKSHPNKYQLRSDTLGFRLKTHSLRKLFKACTFLMKEYLNSNPSCFIGYIGQPDSKDDESVNYKETAQRARIYNLWIATMFQKHRYSFSDPRIFKEVNINLVRKVKNNSKRLSPAQKKNYEKFLEAFKDCGENLYNFMTLVTKEKALARLSKD